MIFVDKNIEDYVEKYTTDESDLLKELSRETHLKFLNPRMLSGQYQGTFLKFLSSMLRPKYVLEIGTYTGYSTIFLANGIADGGKLVTLELNEELKNITNKYFTKAKVNHIVEQRFGEAKKVIQQLHYMWDLVFIDADKINYSAYYDLVIENLSKGGIIVADNILWSGKVLNFVKDHDTKAIKNFTKKVHADDRVDNILLPIRDGLMIIRKK